MTMTAAPPPPGEESWRTLGDRTRILSAFSCVGPQTNTLLRKVSTHLFVIFELISHRLK